MKTLFVAIALVTALSVSGQENPELAPRAMPVNAGPNDIARFLAGMPVPENSPLALLTRDPAWQEHATFFEKEFSIIVFKIIIKFMIKIILMTVQFLY